MTLKAMNTNRRTLIKTATLGTCAYLASRFPTLAQTPTNLPHAALIKSTGGLLETELLAAPTALKVGGQSANLLTYGGSFPGPTLRVREGDTVRLKFSNQLPETSNLHFHGLAISPKVDDPLAEVLPGDSRMYEFKIPRGSAGTYWYHPHIHGKVAPQLFAGLAGLIVVEGPLDAMPELSGAEEHLLVLKDFAVEKGLVLEHTDADWANGKEGNLVLVNGAKTPTLRPQKASLRLRLLNASNARYFRLKLENLPLYLIATDGGLIQKPVELGELLLAPGERAEVLVRLIREGSFKLQALPYDRGGMMMGDMGMGMGDMGGMDHGDHHPPAMSNMPMGAMMGMGPSKLETLLTIVAPARPRPLALPTLLASVERLDVSKAAVQRKLVLSEKHMQAEFFLNDRPFDMGRVDFRGKLGTLEVWELVNKGDMDHPFHLHTYPFQILSRNGKPEAFRAWKDTVNLKKNDRVQIAIPLRNFSGITVYHCHIVEHEDRGMMGVLEVT